MPFIEKFNIKGLKVISFEDGIKFISNSGKSFEIYISVSSTPKRRLLTKNYFKSKNIIFPSLFQDSSKLSIFSNLKKGIYLGEYTTVESNVKVNDFSFINSHTHIGHDSSIGEFSILGGGVIINGGCKVEEYCMLGSSVTVIMVKHRRGSVIQAGTCITKYSRFQFCKWKSL